MTTLQQAARISRQYSRRSFFPPEEQKEGSGPENDAVNFELSYTCQNSDCSSPRVDGE